MEKKHEKELELTLKQSRLKMLLTAADHIANKNYLDAIEWLLNYKDSIDKDSSPAIDLNKSFKEYVDEYNRGVTERDGLLNRSYDDNRQSDILLEKDDSILNKSQEFDLKEWTFFIEYKEIDKSLVENKDIVKLINDYHKSINYNKTGN